jgi:folate-binding protein YgfZ
MTTSCLLTEPGLGEVVTATLLRARFAAKVEIEPEQHTSVIVFGEDGGIPNEELGEPGSELLDRDVAPTLSADEVERSPDRIRGARPGARSSTTRSSRRAGLDETHVSFTKGCYPGQEPIARLHHRGKVNRSLRAARGRGRRAGRRDSARRQGRRPITSAVATGRSATSGSRFRTRPSSQSGQTGKPLSPLRA